MTGYAEGIRILRLIQDLDGPNVNPDCQTRVLTHGRRVERAVVLLHGFTNCPKQFERLGEQLFERGFNVVIPRYPRHGYRDRLTGEIASLQADHLIAAAEQATNGAHGLGDRVTVAGLSLGGVLAAWQAQRRDDLERAVLIAPLFGLQRIPGPLHPPLASLARMLPNLWVWWDSSQKAALPPAHGYPRFSTHAYAALFEVAGRVLRAARQAPPRTHGLAVITNANEPGLDNGFTRVLVETWRRHGAEVRTQEFRREEGLPHDLIDPAQPAQRTDLVYPAVLAAIAGEP
ncbi:MAG TPA: alpha/beta fold hydrolase [Candidatus Acidoferrales bacterium]|nr:alpha/beta fold hydrolase [Candidatus Acidoferrales bacterium]